MESPPPSTLSKRSLEYTDDEAIPLKKLKPSVTDSEPKSYQVMVYEEALRANIICVFDKSAEKMLVTIRLIKEVLKYIGENKFRRLIVFLTPTVQLVQQHCDVIKASQELKTIQFYGEMGVDLWSAETWKKEISDIQVLVMTPQILLDALKKTFLTIEMIELLIFDECHHATGNHQYTKIMKDFYHKCSKKPKVFGMTASLAKKGTTDSESKCAEVESILDSKIYTLTDRSSDIRHVTTAKEVVRYYDRLLFPHQELKTHLRSSLAKCEASLAQLEASPLYKSSDNTYMISKLRNDCLSLHAMIHHCLDDLGLICANEVAKLGLESVQPSFPAHCSFSLEGMSICNIFHEEVICAINNYLPRGYESLFCSEEKCRDAIDNGYISPKLFELLQLLVAFKPNQICCLVFMENINAARVIECFLNKTSFLSHVNVSYLTGGSNLSEAITTKWQRETLELFQQRKINILFMSNVAKEGIDVDVPDCSCVIHFDFPKTVCDYFQSRERLRVAGSYIVMIERGNVQQRDLMFEITKRMHPVVSQYGDAITPIKKMLYEEPELFKVESTGVTVTLDSSVDLISRYCEKLPKDKDHIPYPTFEFNSDGCCVLTLPPGSAFEILMGPSGHCNHKAKQLVCLKACKLLHELKAFDDHLLPVKEPMEIEPDIKTERSAGAGTTKQKELHKAVAISGLSGVWVHKNHDVTLQGYKVNFVCNKEEYKYNSFILLISTVLDEDVASHSIDLYLNDKMVKAYVAPCGPIKLEVEQVEKAKKFHELFFNGVFGKIVKGSNTSGMPRQFIITEDTSSLWKVLYAFFLLPLESPCVEESDELKINWNGLTDIYSVIKYLRRGHNPDGHCSSSNGGETTTASDNKHYKVHLVNKSVDIESVNGMIVMAIHTGKFYSILKAEKGKSAHSPFENSDLRSYAEYFANKYGIVLQRPEQPLLLLKQSHNPHNLLSSNFSHEAQKKSKKKKSTYVEKPLNNVFMPPELLIHIDFSLDVLRSLYLLPSVMHRMESLMLASQLRREISSQSSYPCVPVTLILEAITTLRCCEDFSFERLELLGDSVLKYISSCHLFLNYPEKHEGQLSSHRSNIVCNAMLHKLGIYRNIQGYIRDAAFDPRRWTAPGQVLNRPSPCECTISEENPFEISDANDIVIGKSCDDGHRWICSKTISDCVEALIGAYYVGGGLRAAVSVMKWLGIDVNIDADLAEKFMVSKNIILSDSEPDEIQTLESKIDYQFTTKDLLLEAITYASHYVKGPSYCYQRLEYLGDATLDLLITWHLYNTYTDIDPGELTDLRSAAVNNETFARCAVKYNIQNHLRHASAVLLNQIAEYVVRLKQAIDNEDLASLNNSSKGPKVLGDIVESIAGAILIDTKLDLDKVWKIFKPLLSPIVTPSNLELAPVRELVEIVSHAGYFLNSEFRTDGELTVARLSIQLKKDFLMREGRDKKKKVAKAQAAFSLLKDLEKHGLTRRVDPSTIHEEHNVNSCHMTPMAVEVDESQTLSAVNPSNQVNLTVNMKKGGPRTALAELCQKLQWPMPCYDSAQHNLSAEEAKAKGIIGKNGFIASSTVYIPECAPLKVEGDMRPDKKNAQDSAAVVMLYLLQRQHRCLLDIIGQ